MGVSQIAKRPYSIERRKECVRYLHRALEPLEEFLLLPAASLEADPTWFGFPIAVQADAPFFPEGRPSGQCLWAVSRRGGSCDVATQMRAQSSLWPCVGWNQKRECCGDGLDAYRQGPQQFPICFHENRGRRAFRNPAFHGCGVGEFDLGRERPAPKNDGQEESEVLHSAASLKSN
jgi:hypothetical protein